MEVIIKTMEVVLKKTKITSSILSQSEKATISDMINETIIGWCVFKDNKYIVLYDSVKNLLYKYKFFNNLYEGSESFDGEFQGKFRLKVIVDFGEDFYYQFDTKEELKAAEKLITSTKKTAIEKGQFYI